MSAALDRPSLPRRLLTLVTGLLVATLAALVIAVPLDLHSQWLFAGVTIVGAIVIGRFKSKRATLVIGVLAMIVSTRYLFWRTTHTLEFQTLPELLLGGGLYLAELYAWVILALGFLQTSWPLDRPVVEITGDVESWPTVDVYIPTYNESIEIVRNTVYAAMDMDYPADRFRVFILDDGRRAEFRAFARQMGCGYLTRADNLHAKAGNLNAAMKKTDGELITIFDCDHVPTRAFLQLTVGWFQKDPKLAVLQSPHHFYSPDPVQRNLGAVDMPGEGDLFYGAVQGGNDLWNATFFCGSCAIIRREALMQTNGFAGETVTEDAHTALKLQRMGWNTAYIGIRLSAGLATERLVLHIGQRVRWARGMTQILRIDNPLFGPGLKWQQRLCYLNAMLHFQFPLPRIVFLTSPLAYLIGGQNIIQASAGMIFAYAFPHLFVSMASSERMQGGDRRPFWGEIYESLLAFHLVKPTLYTLINPHKGKFNVTDKGGLLDQDYFDFGTVKPHLITCGLLVFGVALAFGKSFFPYEFDIQNDTLALNTAWALFSLMLLVAAISVARERRQVRRDIRIDVALPVSLYFDDGYVVDCQTRNISMGGMAARMPDRFVLGDRKVTDISLPMGDEMLTVPVAAVHMSGSDAKLRFLPLEPRRERMLVRAVMGRADAWQPIAPHPIVSGLRSFLDIAKVDWRTLRRIVTPTRKAGKKVAASAAMLVALAGGSFTLLPDAARAQAAVAAPAAPVVTAAAPAGGTRQQHLSFKDLQIKTPIRLAGTRGEVGIPFGIRRNEVVTAATLTLNFAYSPALLGDLSHLAVLLNGEIVKAQPLLREGANGTTLVIPVNPALFLPGDNQFNLRFIAHYARDCEDPFHSSLWANISNTRSSFDLTVQTLPLGADLARLPGPFFDRYATDPLKLPFVFANAATDGELEAAASLASWFGSMASYRGFSFKPVYGVLPQGNAIVFMTPDRRIAGIPNAISGPSIASITNPADPYGQLLLVMGRNADELKLAAAALTSGKGVFGGGQVSVEGARIPSYARYSAPRWMRTDRPVKLGELAAATSLQGQGLPPGPLRFSFRVAPDLFFWPRQGPDLDMNYRYPAADWLDRRASRLDISINNQYLRTLPLEGTPWWKRWMGEDVATSHTSNASLLLPRYNLFAQNELIFDYNLILANKQKCQSMVPEGVRVSILPDSMIDLTNTYHALRMPALATFAGAGYPFTVTPDLGETAVLLAPQPGLGDIEAFLELMGRFGDSTGVAANRVTVVRAVDGGRLAGKDILAIGPLALAQSPALFANAPLRYENGKLRVAERSALENVFDLLSPYDRDPSSTVGEFLYGTDNFTGIFGFESPLDKGRSVIAVLASDTNALPQLVGGLSDAKINAQVQGDLSVVTGDGMTSYAVGPGYWVGSLPIWMKFSYWLSQRPLLLALGGLLVALLVSGPIYLLLKRQQRKRLEVLDA